MSKKVCNFAPDFASGKLKVESGNLSTRKALVVEW